MKIKETRIFPRCPKDLYEILIAHSYVEQAYLEGGSIRIRWDAEQTSEQELRKYAALLDFDICQRYGLRAKRNVIIDIFAWALVLCLILCILHLFK